MGTETENKSNDASNGEGENKSDVERRGYVSLCDNCSNKRDTWSMKLSDDGYNGCCLLLTDKHERPDIHKIVAEIVATGWIKIGGRCFNDMVITRETTQCLYYT